MRTSSDTSNGKVELRPFDPSEADGWKLEVSFSRGTRLDIEYVLSGPLSRLKVPQRQDVHHRSDRLYEHTCFEAFVMGKNGKYIEWNFAPSGDWCEFAFESYRKPAKLPLDKPHFEWKKYQADAGKITAAVSLELNAFSDFWGGADGLTLGLSSVLEWRGGNKLYWAFKHPAGKPDFHATENFGLKI